MNADKYQPHGDARRAFSCIINATADEDTSIAPCVSRWGMAIALRGATRTDPMSPIEIPIARTMVGGRWMYES